MEEFIIAIDGPAASGKGVIGQFLGEKLTLDYLDTGLLYRSAALLLRSVEEKTYTQRLQKLFSIFYEENKNNPLLKNEETGKITSLIAKNTQVRNFLTHWQQSWIHNHLRCVVDGRDIGTVVAPNATVKLFITASTETRAKRRYKQLQGNIPHETILQQIIQRDIQDKNRKNAPLTITSDMIVLDTTQLTLEESLHTVYTIIEKYAGKKV